jgi:phosphotriesterase-related protein
MIAERLPVHLIAATGPTAATGQRRDAEEIAAGMLVEIASGIGSTHTSPGVIVVGLPPGWASTPDATEVQAGLRAAQESRLPLIVRTGADQSIFELLAAEPMPPGPFILADIDHRLDLSSAVFLAERGAMLMFNSAGKLGPEADRMLAELVAMLVARGFGGSILVSRGVDRSSDLTAHDPASAWAYILERFTLDLMDAGVDAQAVRTVLIDNPARALTIHPKSPD